MAFNTKGITPGSGDVVDFDGSTQIVRPDFGSTTRTAAAPDSVTVGTSSALAVAANAGRKALCVQNVSTGGQAIFLGFSGQTALLNKGITLYPNGGSYQMEPYDFTTGQINAIASAGSATLSIQEWT